jgi:hypothetical protein
MGGRIVAAVVWLMTLGIAHRIPMLQGTGDFLLTGLLGYLVLDPGKTRSLVRPGVDDRAERWSANFAIRLLQCHYLFWLLISLISHFAEPMWWVGEASWWLAAARHSPWLEPDSVFERSYLINLSTHLFLALHAATIFLFALRGFRPLAIVSSILMAFAVYALSGDWLYSLVLIAGGTAFWGVAFRELNSLPSTGSSLADSHSTKASEKSRVTSDNLRRKRESRVS